MITTKMANAMKGKLTKFSRKILDEEFGNIARLGLEIDGESVRVESQYDAENDVYKPYRIYTYNKARGIYDEDLLGKYHLPAYEFFDYLERNFTADELANVTISYVVPF